MRPLFLSCVDCIHCKYFLVNRIHFKSLNTDRHTANNSVFFGFNGCTTKSVMRSSFAKGKFFTAHLFQSNSNLVPFFSLIDQLRSLITEVTDIEAVT